MKKRKVYFALFIAIFAITYFLCNRYEFHRYDGEYSINFMMLFIMQGGLTFSAANALFTSECNKKAFFINSLIAYVCCILIFQVETAHSMVAGTPTSLVLKALFDPYIFLLHFVYAVSFFIVFAIHDKWHKGKEQSSRQI